MTFVLQLRMLLIFHGYLNAVSCYESYLMGGHLDNNDAKFSSRNSDLDAKTSIMRDLDFDLDAEESTMDSLSIDMGEDPRYGISFPSFAFNGGKPFSLEKDPVTGEIDFAKAPPLKVLNYTDTFPEDKSDERVNPLEKDYVEKKVKKIQKEGVDAAPNEINQYSPNFHDFLNLPIHYSSDKYSNKDKYPLISSSYANTKVQSGGHSYNTHNHRPYHRETQSKPFLYYPTKRTNVPQSTTTSAPFVTKLLSIENLEPSTLTITSTTPPTVYTKSTIDTRGNITKDHIVTKTTTIATKSTGNDLVGSATSTASPKSTTLETKPTGATVKAITNAAVASSSTVSEVPGIMNTSTSATTDASSIKSATKEPVVTTWKPSSTIRVAVDYDEMLPVKKIQSPLYQNDQHGPNNVVPINSQSRPSTSSKNEYYADGYEDYDFREEDHFDEYPSSVIEHQVAQMETTIVTSSPPTMSTTTSSPTTDISYTTVNSINSAPIIASTDRLSNDGQSLTTKNSSHSQPQPQLPSSVTSMPLDVNQGHSSYILSSLYESTNNHHRIPGSGISGMDNFNDGQYYLGEVNNQQPTNSLRKGVLVESTSNIVVPPGQDTVSFVLGNRQNVESELFYSPGTAVGVDPYENHNSPSRTQNEAQGQIGHDPLVGHREILPSSSLVIGNSPQHNQNSVPFSSQSSTLSSSPSLSFKPGIGFPVTWPKEQMELSQIPEGPMKSTNEPGEIQGIDNSKHVVFPNSEKDKYSSVEEHVVVINEADGTVHELTPTTTNPLEKSPLMDDGLPKLAENLTPPAEKTRPPSQHYYQYLHTGPSRNDYPRPQRLPLPPLRNGKPSSSPTKQRPYPDIKLPNILPQFRPNAKASHGHRGPETIGTVPAPQSHLHPTRMRPPLSSMNHQRLPPSPPRRAFPPMPSHLQRLNPPPPPIHAVKLISPASSRIENIVPVIHSGKNVANKRFRPHPISVSSRVNTADESSADDSKRHFETNNDREQIVSLKHKSESLEDVENGEGLIGGYSEEPLGLPPRPPLFPKRRRSDPPRVATLQMIQQLDQLEYDQEKDNSTSVEVKKNAYDMSDRRKVEDDKSDDTVYVVYPVNSAVDIRPDDSENNDESVVVGTRGPHKPLPPNTLLQQKEEDSTREKIVKSTMPMMTVHNNRPTVIASDFPYKLEKPDVPAFSGKIHETPLLIPSDQHPAQKNRDDIEKDEFSDTRVNVIPYLQDFQPFAQKRNDLISATLNRFLATPSSTPIAYVYTPTAHANDDHRLHSLHDLEELHLNDYTFDQTLKRHDRVEKPVLLPSQQPSSSSSSAPSPQNFMAPFVASVNAEEAPSKNGWSVVSVHSDSNNNQHYNNSSHPGVNGTIDDSNNSNHNGDTDHNNNNKEKDTDYDENSTNNNNESDKKRNNHNKDEGMMDSEREKSTNDSATNEGDIKENHQFDPDNFKPQLFGGFQPIYEFPSKNIVMPGSRETSTVDEESIISSRSI